MKIIIIYLFIWIMFISYSCTFSSNKKFLFYDPNIKTNSNNVPVDSTQSYFPTKLLIDSLDERHFYFSNNNDKNKFQIESALFMNKWFSKFLYHFNEPLLFNKKTHKEVFRFTWLRSFDPPIVIRIEKDKNNIILVGKQSNGMGGYEFGTLNKIDLQLLAKSNWDNFIRLVDQSDFWNLPSYKEDAGLDGAEWILEGATFENYHVVVRWCPDDNRYSDFRQLCLYLINLSKLNSKKLDIY